MRLLVLPASATGLIIASMRASQAALDGALTNPAWADLHLAYTDQELYEGVPVPAESDLTPIDRAAPAAPSGQDLYGYAGARRYALEIGSTISVGGAPVPTDERTRGVITAGYVKASADPAFKIESWKLAPGVYVTLEAPTIIAVGDALTAFVQGLFDRNKAVDAGIAAGTITTRAQVDAAFAGA